MKTNYFLSRISAVLFIFIFILSYFNFIEMSLIKLICLVGIYLVVNVTNLITWCKHLENKINKKNRLG